jgi:hypothetical protein
MTGPIPGRRGCRVAGALLALGLASVAGAVEVAVPREWRACTRTDECVEVETLCSACCGVDAIASRYREAYRERYRTTCAGVKGPVCDCVPAPGKLECVEGRCERVRGSGA